jgi:hypothetical protein
MGVLKEYVGKYGKRRISLQCGQLKLHFGNGSDVRLLPMGNDLFTLDTEDNFSRNRVQFERNKTNRKVTGFHFLDDDGDVFPTDKRSADR